MAKLQLHLAEEVRRELPADQLAAVLDGRAVPPTYECIVCRRPGDARRQPTNAVLWVGGQAGDMPAAMLTLVHGGPEACAPSEVRLVDEWAAMPAAGGPSGGEPETVTVADVLQGTDGSRWATLVLQPGTTIRSMLGGELADLGQQALLAQGWAVGLGQVPVVAGWRVQLRAGRFTGILDAAGEEFWQAPDPTLLPDHWQQAAREHGQVLVLVVPPGTIGDDPNAREAISRLAQRGGLVAGRLALTGTLSIPQ